MKTLQERFQEYLECNTDFFMRPETARVFSRELAKIALNLECKIIEANKKKETGLALSKEEHDLMHSRKGKYEVVNEIESGSSYAVVLNKWTGDVKRVLIEGGYPK